MTGLAAPPIATVRFAAGAWLSDTPKEAVPPSGTATRRGAATTYGCGVYAHARPLTVKAAGGTFVPFGLVCTPISTVTVPPAATAPLNDALVRVTCAPDWARPAYAAN